MRLIWHANNKNLKWLLFGIVSIIYAVTQISAFMYIVLIIQLFVTAKSFFRKTEYYLSELIDLLLVSLILPDNYFIIVVSLLLFILNYPQKILGKYKNLIILVFVILYLLFNVAINNVRFENIVMSVIYMVPFYILGISLYHMINNNYLLVKDICESIKKMILLEAVSTIFYAITHLKIISYYNDMDWVTGTLGVYQCNVLMCICTFSLLIFWTEYSINRKKDFIWIVISGFLALATGAVAYTIVFAFSVFLIINLSLRTSIFKKIVMMMMLFTGAIAFVFIVPKWMSRELFLLTDMDYIYKRVTKLHFYENTFMKIPENEGMTEFIFGTGIGQYSSRAADTCAGGYVSLYDSFFGSYETDIRKKYISSVNYGGDGLTASSASSILSLQGELGLIGLMTVMIYFAIKIRKGKHINSKIAVVYFIGLMFFDNTLEFAKYGAIFWLSYYTCSYMKSVNNKNISKKLRTEVSK